jgi:hypothetical protein
MTTEDGDRKQSADKQLVVKIAFSIIVDVIVVVDDDVVGSGCP